MGGGRLQAAWVAWMLCLPLLPSNGCYPGMREAVLRGELNAARAAVSLMSRQVTAQRDASWLTLTAAPNPVTASLTEDFDVLCAASWQSAVDELLSQSDALARIAVAHTSSEPPLALTSSVVLSLGGNGSDGFLKLPALKEVAVSVAVPTGVGRAVQQVVLGQDGFLRPYDDATVLWPAGYLLAQWVAAQCPVWRRVVGRPVLELGAGVGLPSITAALCGGTAVATDRVRRSLAAIVANAASNGVWHDGPTDPLGHVRTERLDWLSDTDVARVAAGGPYAAIIGASLKYEEWSERLWPVLDELSKSTQTGTITIALVHTVGSLPTPPSPFVERARIPGLAFGMYTRWSANETDWEVVVIERSFE